MSVVLGIENEVVNGNESINFSETTGAYNVSTNPNGWNTPNTPLADALTAKAFVYLPQATVPVEINVFTSSFPTVNESQEYNITPSALGLGSDAVLPDGIYTIQYIVTGTSVGPEDFSLNTSETFPIVAAAQCCVDKMFLAIDPCGCACGDDKLMQAFWAQALLDQAVANACCGQIDSFYTLLEQVNKICTGNCKTC